MLSSRPLPVNVGLDGVFCCDFEKNQHFRVAYALWEGGGGHSKVYSMYAFINVDNCELRLQEEKQVCLDCHNVHYHTS